MKKISTYIFVLLSIVLGWSVILFILRLIWLPPSPKGMMMGRDMMFRHMGIWMRTTSIVTVVVILILILIFTLLEKSKK